MYADIQRTISSSLFCFDIKMYSSEFLHRNVKLNVGSGIEIDIEKKRNERENVCVYVDWMEYMRERVNQCKCIWEKRNLVLLCNDGSVTTAPCLAGVPVLFPSLLYVYTVLDSPTWYWNTYHRKFGWYLRFRPHYHCPYHPYHKSALEHHLFRFVYPQEIDYPW